MNAKGGALVIGSLYWDDDIDKKIKDGKRKEWRDTCLNVDNNIKIKVPIRYGRYSSKWQSYTMTFSTSLDRVDFGSSYVLPHKTSTSCETDLLNHATVMGKVEGIPSGLFCDWGAVGLLINPSSSLAG